MSWASRAKELLRQGKPAEIKPRGTSMTGLVEDGQVVVVEPIDDAKRPITKGDVVLCHVHGREYLHLVLAIRGQQPACSYLIGNNHGRANGWVGRHAIYGRMRCDQPA